MAYVTPEEVKAIMAECSLTDSEVDPYILSAHLLINDVLGSSGMSVGRLRDIEKYLTAHIIASIRNRPTSREKVGEAEVEYANAKFGEGLKATPYGQMVSLLDTSGSLVNVGKRIASVYAIKSFDE